LAQAAIYVALAPKSNASYRAIEAALKMLRPKRLWKFPIIWKDSSYPGAKN